MADALVLNRPVELSLELVAVVGSNFFDAERELGDDIIHNGDGAGLIVTFVILKCPDPGCAVDGGMLVALDGFVVFVFESQEFDIDLNLMSRNLL